MTSFRQIYANRRNARKSTGPITQEGRERSRCNAVRHGLTAETVIGALEDAEDYKAFEAAIIADYDAQSAAERESGVAVSQSVMAVAPPMNIPQYSFSLETSHTAAKIRKCRRFPKNAETYTRGAAGFEPGNSGIKIRPVLQ